MRKLRNILVVTMIIVTVVTVSSCATYDNFKETFLSEKGAASDTIKVGVLEPQTGNDSKAGDKEIQGIELAHDVVNEVLGKKIELVYADTQSSIYVAESAVQDLISKKPVIVLGTYGETCSLVASKYLGESKIPAITMTSTNPLITETNEYYYRVCFSESSQGKALAEYVYNKLGQTTAAVARIDGEDATNDIIDKFTKRLTALGGVADSISTTVEIDAAAKDYSAYAKELIDSGIKTVFMPTSMKVAEKLFKELDSYGNTGITFIGTKDWHNNELIDLQYKHLGIRIAVATDFSSGLDDDTVYNSFIKAFKEKYPDLEPTEEAALGYDAYMLAVKAIEKANSIDGYLIKEALGTTIAYNGASGMISFDETGDPEKTINIDTIYKKQFVSVYTTENNQVDESKTSKSTKSSKTTKSN